MEYAAAAALYLWILWLERKQLPLKRSLCAGILVLLPVLLLGLPVLCGSTRFFSLFLIVLYLLWLAVTDGVTMHISRMWIVWSALFLLVCRQYPAARFAAAGALSFSLPAFYLAYRKGWMGTADPWFLLLFGWILGLERMLVCMIIALALALPWSLIRKEGKIPFLVFLSIGFFLAFVRGYTLYSAFFL